MASNLSLPCDTWHILIQRLLDDYSVAELKTHLGVRVLTAGTVRLHDFLDLGDLPPRHRAGGRLGRLGPQLWQVRVLLKLAAVMLQSNQAVTVLIGLSSLFIPVIHVYDYQVINFAYAASGYAMPEKLPPKAQHEPKCDLSQSLPCFCHQYISLVMVGNT